MGSLPFEPRMKISAQKLSGELNVEMDPRLVFTRISQVLLGEVIGKFNRMAITYSDFIRLAEMITERLQSVHHRGELEVVKPVQPL